jgi:hypothetical protein
LVGFTELRGEYERLRSELDAAYTGPVWNSRKIDGIAERMARIEYALASAQHGHGRAVPGAAEPVSLAVTRT